MLQRAFDLGLTGCAITDHESVSAHVSAENYVESQRKNDKLSEEDRARWSEFKLIRGNEIYLCRSSLNSSNFDPKVEKFYHFILLALDDIGHKQLRDLSTRAYKRSFVRNDMVRPFSTYNDLKEIIKENQGHVIGSSACLGSKIDELILKDEIDAVESLIDFFIDIFGEDNFYLELQPSNQEEQKKVNKTLLFLSKKLHVPAIITTDSHMLCKEDLPLQEAFLNSKDSDREVLSFYESAYMMDAQEIHSYLDDYLPTNDIDICLNNTNKIAARATNYTLKKPFKLPFMPLHTEERTSLPDEIKDNEYFLRFLNSPEQSDRIFINRVVTFMENGDKWFDRDFWFSKRSLDRLSTELDYLWISSEKQNMRWTKYLLQMADYIEIIWDKADTLVAPGRGSAVSETLNYILQITQINPLAEKAPMKPWRFINPERASILDIDTDVQSNRRNKVISALQNQYGEFNVIRVMTKKTEASRSSILTSGRGLGMDNDVTSYIANMIVSDRGAQRSLHDTYYGDDEKDFAPNKAFVEEMNKYPLLWSTAQRIEGLVTGQSSHAGGVIIYEESITNTNSLMKLKSGDFVTAFDLHQAEDLSNVKIDMLATEGLVRIRTCIDLLTDAGYLDKNLSLKERYINTIGPYNLNRDDPKMWEMIWNNQVISLFQMEKDSGIKGIKLIKPKTVEELAVLNSVLRLMASEKGAEQPLDQWARYRANINEWYDEMRDYGLDEENVQWLANYPAITDGICESQEGLMVLVQEPKCGGNSLAFADRARKAIAKKQGKLFEECQNEFFKNAKEKNCDDKLVHYVWDVLFRVQRGYSFNALLWRTQA